MGISGSYGGWNLGDEAILQSIITQLRRDLPVEITVFSRDAEDTRRRHRVERAVPVRTFSRTEITPEIEGLDLFILGGGGILFDTEARTFLRELKIAQEKGIPCLVYAIGAGPLNDPETQRLIRDTFNQLPVITVRGRDDKRVLEDIGVRCEITITADPAFLLEPEPLSEEILTREHMTGGQKMVGMSVREPGPAAPDVDDRVYHQLLANAADFIIDRYDADIVFVPMERRMLDVQHSHAVISRMLFPQRAWVLHGDYSAGQMLTMMKRFEFAVGMRLHFLIFAALQQVPFVALPYANKVGGLLEEMHIPMPPLNLINTGRLIAHIDSAWDSSDEIKANIRQVLPALKKRAAETNNIAVKMLKQRAKTAAT